MMQIQINGRTISEVASMLFKVHNTKGWRNRFIRHGPDGLDDKPRSGRPTKIKNQTLDKFIKKADPVLPSLVAEATAETGAECSAATVRRRMHSTDYARKTPMPVYFRRASAEEAIGWQKMTGYWISLPERDDFLLVTVHVV